MLEQKIGKTKVDTTIQIRYENRYERIKEYESFSSSLSQVQIGGITTIFLMTCIFPVFLNQSNAHLAPRARLIHAIHLFQIALN